MDDRPPLDEQKKETSWPRPLLRSVALVVTFAIVGAAALGLLLIERMEGEISVQAFEDVILSWGHWGVLASIGLMTLHSFVPFPAELVAIANGMLYGPLWGTVITWVGAMLGAFLAFGLSRTFGRPFIEAVVARRHWQALDDWTGRHAPQMVFLARFLPVISFNLVNYAAGLTKISGWTFGWTTGLGILPSLSSWPRWAISSERCPGTGGLRSWLSSELPGSRFTGGTAVGAAEPTKRVIIGVFAHLQSRAALGKGPMIERFMKGFVRQGFREARSSCGFAASEMSVEAGVVTQSLCTDLRDETSNVIAASCVSRQLCQGERFGRGERTRLFVIAQPGLRHRLIE